MKRMIDNKDYEDLKDDVTTLKSDVTQVTTDLGKAKDKGMYYALEEPTENEGVYTYAKLTLGNINPDIPLKVGDLIISFDATDSENIKVSNIWVIDNLTNEDYPIVVLVGKVGGSKQLYQHCISLKDTTPLRCYLTIINDDATPFTSKMLYDFLIANGNTSDTKSYMATGVYETNVIHSLVVYNNSIYFNWGTASSDKTYASLTNAINDVVIEL